MFAFDDSSLLSYQDTKFLIQLLKTLLIEAVKLIIKLHQ